MELERVNDNMLTIERYYRVLAYLVEVVTVVRPQRICGDFFEALEAEQVGQRGEFHE